jgi:preprotein translocase subunit SecA
MDPNTGEDELAMANAALAAEGRAPVQVMERRAPAVVRKADEALDPNNPATWGRGALNEKCPCNSGKKYKHCHGRHE